MPRPELTYAPSGGSVDLAPARIPDGYRVFRHEAVIGRGGERWAVAAQQLLEWGLQRGSGIRVDSPRVELDADVVLTIPLLGVVPVTAPARVITLVDEPRRRGFAYGTLPGHPESGEEAFLVTIDGDETVRLVLQGFSRPARGAWGLAAPLTRRAQRHYTGRYLRAFGGSDETSGLD